MVVCVEGVGVGAREGQSGGCVSVYVWRGGGGGSESGGGVGWSDNDQNLIDGPSRVKQN